MTMNVKTMEFDTIIVRYSYRTKTMTIEAKPDIKPVVRDEPEVKGAIVINGRGIPELVEALAGIGHEIPGLANL